MKIITTTQKFTIREFAQDDEDALIRNISSDAIYTGTFRIPKPFTQADAHQYLAARLESYQSSDPKSLIFAIDINGEVVGDVGFKYILGHKGEIVYWLADAHHGNGIMTEAANLVVEYGFKKLGLARIYAEIYIENTLSQNVIKKLGFTKEGEHKRWLVKDGKFKDIYYFAKLNPDI